MKFAFVIYENVGILDLAGPVEVMRGWPGADFEFVARTDGRVVTDSGLELRPTKTVAQLRDPDIVVIPGTGRPQLMVADEALVEWMREVSAAARWWCPCARAPGSSGRRACSPDGAPPRTGLQDRTGLDGSRGRQPSAT